MAVIDSDAEISFEQLEDAINSTVVHLRSLHVAEGTQVALFIEPSWQYITILWALFRLKGVAVPLNYRLPYERVPILLDEIGCRLLIASEEARISIEKEKITLIDPHSVTQKRDSGPSSTAPSINERQEATILFSSGSTGTPKAILHTWGNHYYNALGSNENMGLHSGDRWLLSLPLFHVAGIGILFRCFLSGATLVIPESNEPIDRSLEKYGISHASLVSTQLRRLLDGAHVDRYSNLRALLIGGGSISGSLIERAIEAQLPLYTTYGLTEMASQVTTTPPGAPPHFFFTSGAVLPYRELKCAEDGEILVRGSTLCKGYVRNGEIHRAEDKDGWFHTRDRGWMDSEGLLHVTGRIDNMFISGGENIYPEYVEEVLELHEDVRRAVVVPIPDKEFDMRPVAFIDCTIFERVVPAMDDFLSDKLPRYMHPDLYLKWDLIDRNTRIKEIRKTCKRIALEHINT